MPFASCEKGMAEGWSVPQGVAELDHGGAVGGGGHALHHVGMAADQVIGQVGLAGGVHGDEIAGCQHRLQPGPTAVEQVRINFSTYGTAVRLKVG